MPETLETAAAVTPAAAPRAAIRPLMKSISVRRPATVAWQLALAHHLQAAIERGFVADQAALARKLGLTRARVTQLFDLLMLAADLQEQVLALEADRLRLREGTGRGLECEPAVGRRDGDAEHDDGLDEGAHALNDLAQLSVEPRRRFL